MTRRLLVGTGLGLAGAALVVLLLAPHASREPDGLEKVAIDEGFAERETTHALDDTPTAGYTIEGSDGAWGTVAAGLVGVAVTFALAGGLVLLARRRPAPTARGASPGAEPAATATVPDTPVPPPGPGEPPEGPPEAAPGTTANDPPEAAPGATDEDPPGAVRGVAAGGSAG